MTCFQFIISLAFTFSFLFWQKIITIHCCEKFQFQLSEQQHSWLQKSFFAPINWKYHDRFLLYLKRTIEVLALKKENIVRAKKFFVRIWKTLGNSWTRIFTHTTILRLVHAECHWAFTKWFPVWGSLGSGEFLRPLYPWKFHCFWLTHQHIACVFYSWYKRKVTVLILLQS